MKPFSDVAACSRIHTAAIQSAISDLTAPIISAMMELWEGFALREKTTLQRWMYRREIEMQFWDGRVVAGITRGKGEGVDRERESRKGAGPYEIFYAFP